MNKINNTIKKAKKDVAKWPKWKRDAMDAWLKRINEPVEMEKSRCGCGYADCNRRGY